MKIFNQWILGMETGILKVGEKTKKMFLAAFYPEEEGQTSGSSAMQSINPAIQPNKNVGKQIMQEGPPTDKA